MYICVYVYPYTCTPSKCKHAYTHETHEGEMENSSQVNGQIIEFVIYIF